MSKAPRNSIARHGPEEGMQRRRLLAKEVPGAVVRRRRLGDLIVGPGLDGVDQIGELDGVLDEEDGDVVADNVKVALIREAASVSTACSPMCDAIQAHLQSDGKAMDIACRVCAAARASHGGEAHECRRLLVLGPQKGRRRDVAEVAIAGKGAVRTGPASMDSPFGHLRGLLAPSP